MGATATNAVRKTTGATAFQGKRAHGEMGATAKNAVRMTTCATARKAARTTMGCMIKTIKGSSKNRHQLTTASRKRTVSWALEDGLCGLNWRAQKCRQASKRLPKKSTST